MLDAGKPREVAVEGDDVGTAASNHEMETSWWWLALSTA